MKVIRLILVKVFYFFKRGSIQVGITGSIIGWPSFRVRDKGKIVINKHCRLSNCNISAVCGGNIEIGEGTSIGRNDIIVSHGEISIGKKCSIGPNVCIYDHDHCFGEAGKKEGFKVGKVKIGDNVWIGAGVIILRNTTIGNNCVIGAGTVISGNIPDNTLVTSNRELVLVPLNENYNSKG